MRRVVVGVWLGLLLAGPGLGCSSSTPPSSPPRHDGAIRPAERPPRAPGTLLRSEVVAAVNDGLGRFLGLVDLQPSAPNGKFVGHQVVALGPPEFWQGVDLQPGDVITQVNGQPIETDKQAFETFQSLKTANELVVSILRAGEPRTLRYRIVEDDAAPAASADAG
ncbi:MAG: hypothetical protein KF718_09675 [Polyangiaceae bacterium]|nr:hypothetical protein [Polyangiaceae bacterium]